MPLGAGDDPQEMEELLLSMIEANPSPKMYMHKIVRLLAEGNKDKFIEEIYITYNQSGTWTEPKVISIASEYNVGTAGISPDGQKMLIYMGTVTDPGSLFMISKA